MSYIQNISSSIISKYQGTICISLSVILFNILWLIIWGSCIAAYWITAAKTHCTTEDHEYYTTTTCSKNINYWIIFLLLISMYWGFNVNKNVSHTTTCGVAATWYFSAVIDHKPTPAAFKRTMTTSFGSVCLGSLIVAFLQAVRAMLRGFQNSRSCLTLIALCLLKCIENLIRYFNKLRLRSSLSLCSHWLQTQKHQHEYKHTYLICSIFHSLDTHSLNVQYMDQASFNQQKQPGTCL